MNKIFLNGSLYLKRKPKTNPLLYKGLSSIHQLLVSEEGYFLRQRDCAGNYFEDLIPVTIEQLEKEYINLLDFLNEAEYIGKKGRMTQSTAAGDIQFCIRKPIVLYRGKEHIIIYTDENDFSKLRFGHNIPIQALDYRYMDNWEYNGEQTNIYNNPQQLNKELIMDSFDLTEQKGYQRKLK